MGMLKRGAHPQGNKLPSLTLLSGNRKVVDDRQDWALPVPLPPHPCKCVSLPRSQNHLIPGNSWISDHRVRDIRSPAFSMSHAQTAAAREQYDFWPEAGTVSRTAEWK